FYSTLRFDTLSVKTKKQHVHHRRLGANPTERSADKEHRKIPSLKYVATKMAQPLLMHIRRSQGTRNQKEHKERPNKAQMRIPEERKRSTSEQVAAVYDPRG
ncbi:hypothetical protein OSTOST_01706, partial [Ostertagia ostertagi]